MFLCYSILMGASITWTSSAESASHPAVWSQSYDRGDIPLSHNSVHVYTNSALHEYSKPRNQLHDIQPQLKNYHHIQYAPLPMNIPERDNRNEDATTEAGAAAYTEKINEGDSTKRGRIQKAHLEPQFLATPAQNYKRPRPNPYAHGYNINEETLNMEMFQQKSYPYDAKALDRKKQLLVNYFQPPITYHNPEQFHTVQTTEAVIRKQYSNCNPVLALSNGPNQDLNKYNRNIFAGKENIDPVKASKVAMNVARTLSIARSQRKATINFNSNFRKKPSLPHDFFISQNLQISKSQMNPK